MASLVRASMCSLWRAVCSAVVLIGVGIAVLAMGCPVHAQVDRTVPAFQLASVTPQGRFYEYRYRVAGYGGASEVLSDVYLEFTAPKTARSPVVLGVEGDFLFDGMANHYATMAFSHPPIYIGIPPGWHAAVMRQGFIAWSATRYANGVNYGVRHGATLDGFVLRSTALPAFREYRVLPYRPFPTPAAAQADRVDSTWSILHGYVLAPGWEAADVTGDYLRDQIDMACRAYFLDTCGRYLRYADLMVLAERGRDDHNYMAAIRLMRAHLAQDKVTHAHARFVLMATLDALERRLPSTRPESPHTDARSPRPSRDS